MMMMMMMLTVVQIKAWQCSHILWSTALVLVLALCMESSLSTVQGSVNKQNTSTTTTYNFFQMIFGFWNVIFGDSGLTFRYCFVRRLSYC